MKLSEKILDQIPFHEILDYVEKKNTPQSVAGQRVGAKPGSRKAQIKEHFNKTFIIKKP